MNKFLKVLEDIVSYCILQNYRHLSITPFSDGFRWKHKTGRGRPYAKAAQPNESRVVYGVTRTIRTHILTEGYCFWFWVIPYSLQELVKVAYTHFKM
ncbi:hypothetical protein LR48_Vigan09g155300 [Vigna angularis]|uniref:Uncharacterized protein n=1 Tax=Phaseolus angularis TaxID=3914 RepID=A0A0L9VE04_PHAAN|nr:hypothetical protein LR48_Vigan09g155300 [Vigna angularis]